MVTGTGATRPTLPLPRVPDVQERAVGLGAGRWSRPARGGPGRPGQAWRRTSTVRNRLATKAASQSAALADGLPPEPWRSEKAAVWLT